MPGLRVTIDAAMRARDVSRPHPEHHAAAAQDGGATSAVPASEVAPLSHVTWRAVPRDPVPHESLPSETPPTIPGMPPHGRAAGKMPGPSRPRADGPPRPVPTRGNSGNARQASARDAGPAASAKPERRDAQLKVPPRRIPRPTAAPGKAAPGVTRSRDSAADGAANPQQLEQEQAQQEPTGAPAGTSGGRSRRRRRRRKR